jgi:hypothetical protein
MDKKNIKMELVIMATVLIHQKYTELQATSSSEKERARKTKSGDIYLSILSCGESYNLLH